MDYTGMAYVAGIHFYTKDPAQINFLHARVYQILVGSSFIFHIKVHGFHRSRLHALCQVVPVHRCTLM